MHFNESFLWAWEQGGRKGSATRPEGYEVEITSSVVAPQRSYDKTKIFLETKGAAPTAPSLAIVYE